MSVLNKSLAYIGETLIYNHEYELLWQEEPPGPLPAYTMRLRYKDGTEPVRIYKGSVTQISENPNIWDYTYNNANWDFTLNAQYDLIEVVSANIVGVSSLNDAFHRCTALSSVNWFDTSTVNAMGSLFNYCYNLSSIPLLDTSKVTYWEDFCFGCTSLSAIPPFEVYSSLSNIQGAFYNCVNVQSGQYDLYTKMAAANPTYYNDTFYECGVNSPMGSAELARIPADWK